MESATKLFEAEGYERTSVQSIVDDAAITKGAFYHHFSAKEDLLREIHDTFIDEELERMDALLERNLGPEETVRLFFEEVIFEAVSQYKPQMTVFFRERNSLSPKTFAAIEKKRDRLLRGIEEIVRRGVDAGAFRDVASPTLVSLALIGMGAWSYQWLDPAGDLKPREIARIFADIALNGLAKGEADA